MKSLGGGALASPRQDGAPVKDDPLVRGILRHLLADPRLTSIIPGITCVEEVEQNVATANMDSRMTDEELEQLMRDLGHLGKELRYGQRCLRCGYCQPCPEGIIPAEVFRAEDMFKAYPDDLKFQGVRLYESLDPKPDACVECGECVKRCPAGINIPERLKEVVELFANAG